jgi:stage II sporulation protein D
VRRRAPALLALAIAAACARGGPPPRAPAPPPAAPAPDPQPAAPATPLPEAAALEPAAAPEPAPTPPTATAALVRVGLATDLPRLALPCCDAAMAAEIGGRSVAVTAPLDIEPLATVASIGLWRLQVAALKDEGQARGLAAALERASGKAAEAVFDARSDLYRVRVGRYSTRAEAEAAQPELAGLGVEHSFAVTEGGGVADPGFRVTQRGKTSRVDGRWLAVHAEGEGGVRVEGRRYRGRILVYLNDRGLLNLINELPLEAYLRGVVPRELGPRVFNQLEALKAQAVAARTYTMRNLGEFSLEGYDICATPRCQVYGGMDDEDPLTDRAVAETAGEVLLHDGRPIDALYSSTCGGHTEDVHEIFPLKRAPYLAAVPCLESGVQRLAGDGVHGLGLAEALTRRLLPPPERRDPATVLGARLEHLALLAGLPATQDRLASLDRRELQRFLASVFDLATDARLFLADQDLEYLVQSPPPDWRPQDVQLAGSLAKSGLLTAPPDRPLSVAETEELLFRLAQYLQVVREETVSFRSLAERRLRAVDKDGEKSWDLPPSLLTFRIPPGAGGVPEAADLALVPGDRVRLYTRDGELLAVAQEINREGVAYDRTSNLASWTRLRTDQELARLVNTRYPGTGFEDFEILRRGRSGRVSEIRIRGEGGKTVTVEGLAVRWTLDLPDTWFTAKRVQPRGKDAGWLFTGRGWGHGVGLCQVGAYGMAVRGHGYRDILRHYYTGVTLVTR